MKRYLLIIFLLAMLLCSFTYDSKPTTKPKQANNKTFYIDYTLRIMFEYNENWTFPQEGSDYYQIQTHARHEGKDGFFDVGCYTTEPAAEFADKKNTTGSSIQDTSAIEELALSEMNELNRYGTTPSITDMEIQGQKAKLLLPSKDQPLSSHNAAALIIKYPSKIKLRFRGHLFEYFILWADKDHILEISKTIKFLI